MLHNNKLFDFYNSSPMREGILCWYPFGAGASVLDLSGGALTELLRRQCGRVVSGSDADGNEAFDYAVVLDPEDFSVDALGRLKNRLNPRGRLLLAYENPFALRYWSGKSSPVTGLPYDSLFGNDGRVGAAELRIRLKLAGFEGQKWYYPLADHWFTHEVYSESFLPDEYMNQRFIPYIADDFALQFDERGLYREVIRGGAFEFMCGAYLVEARTCVSDAPCVVDYAAVTALREPAKRFATTVRNDGKVLKTPLHPAGKKSIGNILRNNEELARLGVDIVPVKLENESLSMPRINLPTLLDYWAKKLTAGSFDESEMFDQFDRIREVILKASKTGKCYWELVPANCFYDVGKDELIFFDQEYYWEGVSPDVAVTRAILALIYSPAFNAEPRARGWLELLKERYGLAKRWEELSDIADVKTRDEVFGDGAYPLAVESGHAAERAAERKAEYEESARRYKRFYPIIGKLNNLGIKRAAIYGFGLRGRTLREVFINGAIEIAAIFDKKINIKKPMEDLLTETNTDMVIVSILNGGDIAADLRRRTDIPVYTMEELLDERA